MQYLNLSCAVLDSPQFLGSEPLDRATWICLLRYCIGQENNGLIIGCREWKDRKWQQLARVTRIEIERETELWRFSINDLVVFGYPHEQQESTKRLRERGKMAARKRWQIRDLIPDGIPSGNGVAIQSGNGVAHAKDKVRKDKVRKDKPPVAPLKKPTTRLKTGLYLPASP